MKLYQRFARLIIAIKNCEEAGKNEWCKHHKDELNRIMHDEMPSGSGVDNGTKIDIEKSKSNRIIFYCDYHHMDEGTYCGWTNHEIIVKPSLAFDLEIRITGKDRNGIKEYLHQVYSDCLNREV